MGRFWARRSRRAMLTLVVSMLALCGFAGTGLASGWFSANDNPWPYNHPVHSAVLAAVGDTSCQPTADESAASECQSSQWAAQTATANEIEGLHPALVAVLGDEQYQVGTYQDFTGSFDHTYGAFKFLQRPTPGNHEFYDEHGETGVHGYGYFDYYNGYPVNPANGNPASTVTFGPAETEPTPRQSGQAGNFGNSGNGWYSYDLAGWHIISLNAECNIPQHGNCNPNAGWYRSETAWLAKDLGSDHAACTMAYWHQPTFSAANPSSSAPVSQGGDPEGPTARVWWRLLHAHHADLILNGHDHLYARFAPMDPNGASDPRNGIRQFIIGSGGESLDVLNPKAPNLQAGADQYYGVMKMLLYPDGYHWDYQSALENPSAPSGTPPTYSDTGGGRCHGGVA